MNTQLDRMLALSGKNKEQNLINQLKIEKHAIIESYDRTIEHLKNNNQIDEGIFTALKNAFGTANNLRKAGVQGVKNKISTLAGNVKAIYKSARAKAELKTLIDGLEDAILSFENLTKQTNTIISSDPEIRQELEIFKKTFEAMIISLTARQAVAENIETDDSAIKNMLVEMGVIVEDQLTLLEAEKVSPELIKDVMITAAFEEAAKRMKFISTATQLKNGTLVFDTGLNGIKNDGSEDPNSSYLLKIYADGQIRGELKGIKLARVNDGWTQGKPFNSSHYRLGKPITGKNEAEMYKNALIDVVKRYEKKKARYGKEKQIIADRFAEFNKVWNYANYGSEAEPDTKD